MSASDQYAAWDACSAQCDTYGLSLNAVTLARSRFYNCVFQANTAYSCPNGGALNGNQCVSTSSQPATRSYSCSAGTLSGTQCAVPQSYAATPNYSCPNGGTVSGCTCLKTTVYAGTAAYSCPSGGSLSGSTCTQTSSYTATTNYSCPNGDPLSGSTCLKTTVYAGTAAYSCPSGGSLSGSTCTQTSSYTATSNYSCPNGGTVSGSTCLKTTVYAGMVAYSCPSGGSLNGSTCTQTSAYAATPNYSCNAGDTPNGSTCSHTNSVAATPSYSCPNGATLSGSQCTGTTSTRTAYVYLDGKQIAETVIDGATQYVHTDALGSPVAHTNQAGAELNRTKFEPYGLTAAGTKPGAAVAGLTTTGSAIGFTGHVNDPETDLVYMQQRYYDPVAGRFLSIDSVVTDANTGGSFNRYNYANNNPYKYIDPDGLDSFLVSRPLGGDSKIISHNYVVSHATSIGDPNALMHSFGRQSNGATGRVDKTTTGMSEGTATKDAKHWLSLAGDKTNAAENTTKIDAPDAAVASAANSLSSHAKFIVNLLPKSLIKD